MEIGDAVVVILYIIPYGRGMSVVTVERPVYEFYLGNPVVKKKLQFFCYERQIPKTQALVMDERQ